MVQGLGKSGCFVLQGLIAGKDVAYLGFQVRISAHALLFYFSQAGLDQLEGVTHRLEQGLNGLLSGFQIMPSLLVLVLETRFRQVEELFFRVAKDFRTDAGKGIPEHFFRGAEHLDLASLLLWSALYAVFAAIGTVIAGLLHIVFQKED